MENNKAKVITGKCRASYANVHEPKSINGSDPKYSISLIIPKSDTKTIAEIEAAIEVAKQEGKVKLGGKIPKNLKTPLRDGDTDRNDEPVYEDAYFVNANSFERPQIVDINVKPIMDQSEFYSGCYCRASLNFYAFNHNGNKGIACGLGNLQKIADGEPLTSRSTAEDDFSSFDDDDFLN